MSQILINDDLRQLDLIKRASGSQREAIVREATAQRGGPKSAPDPPDKASGDPIFVTTQLPGRP